MRTILSMSGVDTTAYGQHATRAAAAAFLKSDRHLSIREICNRADWSQLSGAFETFYNRYLAWMYQPLPCLTWLSPCSLFLWNIFVWWLYRLHNGIAFRIESGIIDWLRAIFELDLKPFWLGCIMHMAHMCHIFCYCQFVCTPLLMSIFLSESQQL